MINFDIRGLCKCCTDQRDASLNVKVLEDTIILTIHDCTDSEDSQQIELKKEALKLLKYLELGE